MISLDVRIYVVGGATADGTSRVFPFDPATFLVSAAGELPACRDAAAVTSGGIGYLIGGDMARIRRRPLRSG